MKISWTVQSVDGVHRTAIVTYLCGDHRITLNISPMAVQNLDLTGDVIWFSARFSGRAFEVLVPSGAVLAVFARENGEGVVFGEVDAGAPGRSAIALQNHQSECWFRGLRVREL